MNPVDEHFTQRFLNLYGAPDVVNPEAFVAEYDKALGGTDPSLLETASNALVKQHKYRNWPTIGECVAAVEAAALQRAQRREAETFNKTSDPCGPRKQNAQDSKDRVAAMIAKARGMRQETVDNLNKKIARHKAEVIDWSQVSRPAFEARWAASPTLQWLSLPEWWRETYADLQAQEADLKRKRNRFRRVMNGSRKPT